MMRVAALVATLVACTQAHNAFHLEKTVVRELYSVFAAKVSGPRELQSTAEDDSELRAQLAGIVAEREDLAARCGDGILRNAGTADEPVLGCCHPDCVSCMAPSCGASNVDIPESELQFPGVAPMCCQTFLDMRVAEDRGMGTTTCITSDDVGCMLGDDYDRAVASLVPRTDITAVFAAEVVGAVDEDNFSERCLQMALADSIPDIESTIDTEVLSVEPSGRRRRLQDELRLRVAVNKAPALGESLDELSDRVMATLGNLARSPDAMAGLHDAFATAVDGDDDIPADLKEDMKQTQFRLVGLFAATTDEEPEAEAQRTSRSAFYDNGPTIGFAALAGIVVVVLALAYRRRRREHKQTAEALLHLKVDRNASFREAMSEDGNSVYLPPVVPSSSRGLSRTSSFANRSFTSAGQSGSSAGGSQTTGSESGGSQSSGYRGRAWENRRRKDLSASSISSGSVHGAFDKDLLSVSSLSDDSVGRVPALDSKTVSIVMNELDTLTRPAGVAAPFSPVRSTGSYEVKEDLP